MKSNICKLGIVLFVMVFVCTALGGGDDELVPSIVGG